MSQSPDVIYKYVDQEGARKIIANATLRFSRPSGLNDPFDVYIDDLFNLGFEKLQQKAIAEFFELLQNDPALFVRLIGADPPQVAEVSSLVRSISPEERAALSAMITPERLENWDTGLADMRIHLEAERKQVVAQFENCAIFCATRSHDNLLMWAHYAQQHRGVVLGFRPNTAKDSMLAVTKPVRYTDKRPTFYGLLDDLIASGAAMNRDEQAEFRNALVYSKSSHWSYEEEVRIDIPHEVPVGEPASFFKFDPNELTELYFGCRVDQAFRREITLAARTLNPNIEIFDARLQKESYGLAFDPAQDACGRP